MQASVKDHAPLQSDVPAKPQHNIFLSIWLVVSAIITIGAAILFFQEADLASGRDVREVVAIVLIGSLTIGNLYCLWRIWTWYEWGVYGFIFTSLILPLYKDTFTPATALGFIVPIVLIAILYFVIKDEWRHYEH